ncbi:unnamed protein product [Litomosoides sigmodontis]|uniref:PH domain-containing protein n=1 Tax=Litomosoides sigmodontis TaxID=42156 RepID=A0A3P6UWH4_LITSI|nr:unnamed protein product [Litomosoides sigmodontis]
MDEDTKNSSEVRNNETKTSSVTHVDSVGREATELEIVSALNVQDTTAIPDEITALSMQDIELDNEHDLNDNTILMSKDLCNVSKSRSSKTKEINVNLSWNSCFELRLDSGDSQNRYTSKPKQAISLEILPIRLNHDTDVANSTGDVDKSLSTSKKNLCNNNLHNGVYRVFDDCLSAMYDKASNNSRFTLRWKSLSLSSQNCSRTAIFTASWNINAIGIGQVTSISENNVLTSATGFSLNASGHQKTLLSKSCDCISLTELPSNLTPSSMYSNKSFNDSIPWGDVIPSMELQIQTSRNSNFAAEETLNDTLLPCAMPPDIDHTSGLDFNQTQISRQEYVRDKTNVEHKTKVELFKDALKRNSFVTQSTITYPVNHLEMQRFPNSTYQFIYEGKDEGNGDTQMAALSRDQYSQTKEPVVTQSLEDTNKAVSVLNMMLQRRLNNDGSQNASFAQERSNSFYSTPPTGPKLSPQKILNIQSFAETNELNNDFVDGTDALLPNSKYLPAESELFHMNEKATVVVDQQYKCIVQKTKENLKQHYHENNSEETSQKSGSDGRSTIRDRLPRGQTRKLASLFETMSDAASVEMSREISHLKRRGKSVPPNIIGKTYHRESKINIKELFQDDFLEQRSVLTTRSVRYETDLGLMHTDKKSGFKEPFTSDKRIEERSVRSIVNRFESVSALNEHQNLPRAVQTDITPRKPRNQKRYSQYVTKLQSVPSLTNYRSIQNQYAVDSNYNICSTVRSPSPRSDEWNVSAGCGSPSHNLVHDDSSCAWDQEQYELGLRKGIINLKRYDSSYSRMTNEIVSRDPSYAIQTRTRYINLNPELQPNYQTTVTDHSEKRNYTAKLDNEVVDHVAEVEKAFDFVNKAESLVTSDQQCSQESLPKPASSPVNDSYSISLYRDLEREHRKSSSDVSIRFSPVVYAPPPLADERLVKNTKLSSYMVTTDPRATSTPLDGSPATNSRMHTSSYALNRSDISAITALPAQELVQLQQSEVDLQTIKQEIMIQEGQIAQSSLALAHCKKNNSFNGTLVELTAQRGLLLARERLLALQNQMRRLETRRFTKEPAPPLTKRMRGAIDLTSINVYLNRNFCIRNVDENVSYAFVILLKTNERVEATQAVTLMDTRALRVSKIHFSDQIRFTNPPIDFTVLLEIYALKVSENRRSDDYSCSMLRNKAKSLLSPSKKTCGNESVVGFSEFTCCGHICLNKHTVGTRKFYLDGAVYPLEGTIEIDSRCTTLPPTIEIDFQGFLTMYQMIAGLGSWARYWAVLRYGVVQFWKYPDEAYEKPALACMDLSKCTDKEISLAPHEICSRPNAFMVELLVTTSPSVLEKKRMLLSADTKELCSAWLNALNETLEVLRG